MKKFELLSNWLGNRQRTYADGLKLFNELANKTMKEKFGNYLAQCSKNPPIFDPHFTQLVNSLSKINREIKESPSLYPTAQEDVIVIQILKEEERSKELKFRQENITNLQSDIEELAGRIDTLENNNDDHADELSELRDTFDKKMSELATLRNEINALNTPGVKIVTEESLTPSLRKSYARIKEIAPLYASLHADIANPDITDEKRKEFAEELCKLDDERRRLWKQIDDWSEGKGTPQFDEKRPVFSNNSVVRGFEIARQIKRLKSNIANSRMAAGRAVKDGKKTVEQNALDRIAGYEKELTALEEEISVGQTPIDKTGEKISG